MSATTTDPTDTAVTTAAYVAAVAEALAGVPEPERQELLDDLGEHLTELAAEDDEPLDVRLGSPESYAAELVASAGITVEPTAPHPPEPSWRRAVEVGQGWLRGERAEATRTFLAEMRPGWWVLRGWCLAALLAATMAGDERAVFPVPEVSSNPAVALLVLGAACLASVRLGRARGWLDRAATLVGLAGLLVAAGHSGANREVPQYAVGPYLTAPDGRIIENIWPYDGTGNPLDGVLLFDQQGLPIELGPDVSAHSQVAIPGLYPLVQRTYEFDPATGAEREVPVTAPIVSIPMLPSGTSPASTTPASTTTTATPTTVTPVATTTTTAPQPTR